MVWIDAQSSLHPIHAETDGLEGDLELDVDAGGRLNPTAEPRARLSFPVAQLRSSNPLEERELKRRIEARKFPTISGVLTSMKQDGAVGRYLVEGEITFRGVTNTYEEEMSLEQTDGNTIKLTGGATFDVRDFGMDPPRILLLRVHPDVAVRVEIIAEKEG